MLTRLLVSTSLLASFLFSTAAVAVPIHFTFPNGAEVVAHNDSYDLAYRSSPQRRWKDLDTEEQYRLIYPDIVGGRMSTELMLFSSDGGRRVQVLTQKGEFDSYKLPDYAGGEGARFFVSNSVTWKGERWKAISIGRPLGPAPRRGDSGHTWLHSESGEAIDLKHEARLVEMGSSSLSVRPDGIYLLGKRVEQGGRPTPKKKEAPEKKVVAKKPVAGAQAKAQSKPAEPAGAQPMPNDWEKLAEGEAGILGIKEGLNSGIYLQPKHGKPRRLVSLTKEQLTEYQSEADAFTHDGKTYFLYSITSEGGLAGTHLLREDGALVTLSRDSSSELKPKVSRDGILSVDGITRRIDLERLEAEARFEPEVRTTETKNQSGSTADPEAEVRKMFPDLIEEARERGMKSFELSSGDAERMRDIRLGLARPEVGSAVLLGAAGSGKTEIVKAFVAGIARGDFHEIPRTTRVFKVDPSSLNQGTMYMGTFEAKVAAILAAAGNAPTILFIDEIHSLRGAGTHSGNDNDVFEQFKPKLADGTLRIIGTSTEDEFYGAFAGDTAFLRRMKIIKSREPSGLELVAKIRNWLKRFGKPAMPDTQIRSIIDLVDENVAVGAQPSKTTAFLGDVYSHLLIEGREMDKPTAKDIETVSHSLFGRANTAAEADLGAMSKNFVRALSEDVIGQQLGKERLLELSDIALAKAHDPKRPMIRALLAGPPGVGKTELGFALAKAWNVKAHRIEMNRYANGDVDGFRKELASAARKDAHGVIILDEIEKAHTAVMNALLAVLDSGMMSVNETLGSGFSGKGSVVQVSFKKSKFLATTNAGQELVLKQFGGKSSPALGFGAMAASQQPADLAKTLSSDALKAELIREGMSEPVLDRFQEVVPALPATREEFARIVALHVDRVVREQKERHQVQLEVADRDAFIEAQVEREYRLGMSNRRAQDIADLVRLRFARERITNGGSKSYRLRMLR